MGLQTNILLQCISTSSWKITNHAGFIVDSISLLNTSRVHLFEMQSESQIFNFKQINTGKGQRNIVAKRFNAQLKKVQILIKN